MPAELEGDFATRDERWMAEALVEARSSGEDVPIGAVVVHEDRIVSRAHNETLAACDPTAHAEVLVLRRAAAALGMHRLCEAELYVTLEPCAMCVGAMIQGRIARLVFGCRDRKAGAVVSLYELASDRRLNHRVACAEGVFADESRRLLQEFFRARRR